MTRNNQRLFRMARAVVRDDGEAEDVLQEAYTRAFAKFETFRGDASILTWLTRIVLNEGRGRLWRRRNTVKLDHLEIAQQRGGELVHFPSGLAAPVPEASASRSQVRRLMEDAVDALPEAFRVVFILREIEECSVEETASQLGLKPETVKNCLHRARRLLRRALEHELLATMNDAFPFLGARCERITQRVLERLTAVGVIRPSP
jgi:RNA polymerase sigma-70 factor (ECF subfamily)